MLLFCTMKFPLFPRPLLFVVASLVLLASAGHGQDRIVFEKRDIFGNWGIVLMNADGSRQRNLTTGRDMKPSISPDGRYIAFISDRDGPLFKIFVLDVTGRYPIIQLTDDNFNDYDPQWSPDGSKIVFSRCDADFMFCDVFTINSDGSGSLTPIANSPEYDGNAGFSPDGSKVVFVTQRHGHSEIYICNANGSDPVRLTTNNVPDGAPNWSPDGSTILFTSGRDEPMEELYTMNADGSNVIRRTNNLLIDRDPSFSSDGQRIAWTQLVQFNGNSINSIVESPLEATSQARLLARHGESPDYGFISRKAGWFR